MANRQLLTLKYRPQTFAELLIQDHVRDTLTRAIEHNRLANAYLFAGPRGVGKTTTARILAKCLNCLAADRPTTTPCGRCSACAEITESRSIDVLEIDGASSRGIDQVRELRENIRYAPSALRSKVYIVDEVHMLTREAFNAILKTLEEPPAHAKFIFATTEAHRLPLTIISRCQRFDFRRATVAETCSRLDWIAGREGIKVAPDAVAAIAERAGGAVRDAESMLEQAAVYCPEGVELAGVEELFGLVPARKFHEYAELLLAGDAAGLVRFVDRLFEDGHDPIEFHSGLVGHFRRLLLLHYGNVDSGLPPEEQARLEAQSRRFRRESLLEALSRLSSNEDSTRRTALPRILLEIVSLEIAAEVAGRATDPDPAPACARDRLPSGHSRPRPAPADATAVWQELRLRVNEHKPMLASILDLATPVSFTDGVLALTLPQRQQVAAGQLEAGRSLVDRLLSEVAGGPARLQVTLIRSRATADPVIERISRVLGELDEERSR